MLQVTFASRHATAETIKAWKERLESWALQWRWCPGLRLAKATRTSRFATAKRRWRAGSLECPTVLASMGCNLPLATGAKGKKPRRKSSDYKEAGVVIHPQGQAFQGQAFQGQSLHGQSFQRSR